MFIASVSLALGIDSYPRCASADEARSGRAARQRAGGKRAGTMVAGLMPPNSPNLRFCGGRGGAVRFLAGVFRDRGGAILSGFYECFRLAGRTLECGCRCASALARHHHSDLDRSYRAHYSGARWIWNPEAWCCVLTGVIAGSRHRALRPGGCSRSCLDGGLSAAWRPALARGPGSRRRLSEGR